MNSAASSRVAPLRDFSDRLSPMVVKELRHGLRTSSFAFTLIGFHLLLLIIIGGTFIGVEVDTMNRLFWIISIVTMLGLVPLRGFSSLSAEAEGGLLDMLSITTLSSYRIVWGKWLSLFSQSMLVASSLLPYLVARHQFGGVEIAREIAALVILLLASALATAVCVGFSRHTAKWLRVALCLIVLGAIVSAGQFTFRLAEGHSGEGWMGYFFDLDLTNQIAFVVGGLVVTVCGVYLLVSMAASTIAPEAENHSVRKRAVSLVAGMVLTIVGCTSSLCHKSEAAAFAFYPLMVITLAIGMDVVTEPMPRSPAAVLDFVKRGTLGRCLGYIFYPGEISGVLWYALMAVMPMVLAGVMVVHGTSLDSNWNAIMCALSIPLAPTCLPFNRSDRFTNWWAVQSTFLAIVAVGWLGLAILDFLHSDVAAYVVDKVSMISGLTPVTWLGFSYWTMNKLPGIFWNSGLRPSDDLWGPLAWTCAAFARAVWKMSSYTALDAEALVILRRQEPHQTPM